MATSFNFLAPPNQNELGAAFGYYPQTGFPNLPTQPGGGQGDAIKAIDPTIRQRLADFLQAKFEDLGMDRYKARQNAQTIVGGGSSNLPLNMGLADIVPFLGTALQTEESAILAGKSRDSLNRGDYGTAAMQYGGAALGMLPGAAATIKVAGALPKNLPMGLGTEAVGGMGFLNPKGSAARPATDLEYLQNISDQYAGLNSKGKALADAAFTGELTGTAVPRSEVSKLLKGNPDIAKSILSNPAFKINGYVPRSVIDDALGTRIRMKAEGPTTPGAKGTEAEWKAWGEKHGVNMTVTEPKSLGITDLTTKREIRIPGGLEGKFTVPDMFWMKANNIDPGALPKEMHDQLMQKLIRTHEVANPDQVDMFNRLSFAQLSPNAPLTPNEFLAQRLRLTNMDELQALAGRVGEPNLSATAQQQTGVQAAARGGMGVLGTADLKNQAMLAKLILDKPEMFQMAPGETMRDVTLRVMNQVPGLGPKTASLGTPWLDLNRANTSAVDLHMIRHSYKRMLEDPIVGEAFRIRMGDKLGVEPTAEAILGVSAKRSEKAAIDVIGGSQAGRKYRVKGELNEIPGVATPEKLAYEPQNFQDFNPFYKRVVDYVDESRGPNPSIELFPEQWRKWDVYRQRLEPHEFAHPDYRLLPKQSWEEMRDALAIHKQAGYTGKKPVMKEGDWRELYYGRATPAAMLGTAGLAGAGIAAQNMLAPRSQNMLGQELPPNP